MKPKDTKALKEAKADIRRNQDRAPYLSDWLHVKSGGKYVVKMHVLLEATLEPAVIYYKRYDDPLVTLCLPASEFFDGRFERIAEAA